MTAKFDAFASALEELCREHGVCLRTGMFLVVDDLEEGDKPFLMEDLEDWTAE